MVGGALVPKHDQAEEYRAIADCACAGQAVFQPPLSRVTRYAQVSVAAQYRYPSPQMEGAVWENL